MVSVICLNFVLVNLFIGVLCFHFEEAKNSATTSAFILTREQQIWLDLQKMIVKVKIHKKKKKEKKKKKFDMSKVLNSRIFDISIMSCIILNIIVMSMNYEGSSSSYNNILNDFNYAFTGVFILECLIKIWQFGFINYIKDNWNKMDFIIIILSILELILTTSGAGSNNFLRIGPQIIRIFRIVRVVRLLRLLRRLDGLKKLMQNLILSLPNVFSVFLLLLLFFYIYSVLGVFLFKDINTGNDVNANNNFDNFLSAFFLLLTLITYNSWSTTMFDCFNISSDCVPGQTCGTSKF